MKSYYIRLLIFTLLLILAVVIYNALSQTKVPLYGMMGLVFLSALSGFIHYFVYGGDISDPKKTIRRMMAGSMIRMIVAILFLAITLISFRPLNIPFVISYTGSFFLLMVFEISQIRRKLRPDFNAGSK